MYPDCLGSAFESLSSQLVIVIIWMEHNRSRKVLGSKQPLGSCADSLK